MKKFLQKCLSLMTVMQLIISLVPSSFASTSALRVMDTTAGTPALILLTGEPNEVVELSIINPFQSGITQSFQLNDEGVLQYWYRQAVTAGEYAVVYKDLETHFTVSAGLPAPNTSRLELNDYTAYVGKGTQGSLVLKDAFGNIISGRNVSLDIKGGAQVNCLKNCRTDQKGMLSFSISAQNPGLKKLTVLDQQTHLKIFQEDLGFIPQVQAPVVYPQGYGPAYGYGYNGNPYNSYGPSLNMDWMSPNPSAYSPAASSFDYIPLLDPTRATFNAQGNSDRAASKAQMPISTFMGANIFDTSSLLAQVDTVTSSSLVQNTNKVDHLEIILSNDPEAEYEEEVTVTAQSALDIIVRAVNSMGNRVETYTGKITFKLPNDILGPNDYEYSALDKGEALFELALILPEGDLTLIVEDRDNPAISGEVSIHSQLYGSGNLNNTNIQLTIESPIANGVYAKDLSVQGSTSTENTEIVIKEGSNEIKRGQVDENKHFSFILDLEDGNHSLDITAVYLPDGSETQASVSFEVDKTPPVITQVNVPSDPVRAGESFTITAIAEERSTLTAFIDNRSYDFVSKGADEYELVTNAPLDEGSYPVHVRATDEMGNETDSPDVGVLNVVPALQEIANLFGIPGIEAITLSWAPVEGASQYEVSYRSILGKSEQTLTTEEPRITVKDLAANLTYIFTVVAKDMLGNDASKETESKAIKVLEAPVGGGTIVIPENMNPAAPEVETMPVRHTKSGPEVYLLLFSSLILLNVYGKARKAMMSRE